MTRRQVQLVVLCEDLQQEVFARHFFIERGFHPRKITYIKSPKGKGAGEQFVREQYPREVQAYRSRAAHLSLCLAVVIDADTYSVEERINQFDEALENASQPERQPTDKIAIFVPKRNIETWIYFLRDEAVDEQTAYPKLSRESDCKPDVRKLVSQICPTSVPEDAPPSLHSACAELERIL